MDNDAQDLNEHEDVVITDLIVTRGWPDTEATREIMHFYIVCMDTYANRSVKYKEAWRRFGALNNLVRAAAKAERLLEQFWYDTPKQGAPIDLDDAVDASNYLAFFHTQASAGQWRRDTRSMNG